MSDTSIDHDIEMIENAIDLIVERDDRQHKMFEDDLALLTTELHILWN